MTINDKYHKKNNCKCGKLKMQWAKKCMKCIKKKGATLSERYNKKHYRTRQKTQTTTTLKEHLQLSGYNVKEEAEKLILYREHNENGARYRQLVGVINKKETYYTEITDIQTRTVLHHYTRVTGIRIFFGKKNEYTPNYH